MNKIVYFFAITHLFIATSSIFAMEEFNKQLCLQSPEAMYHTHNLFDDFDNTLDQQDRRNLRATFAPIWRETPMPKPLISCANKQQTNCAFLAAVHYAAVEKETTKNNYLIRWVLDYRTDQQFSFYMKRACNNVPQEYHISPRYVAETNNDHVTLDLLQHNGYSQKKIFSKAIFYLPGPLLWACIGNNVEQAEIALANEQEMEKLIKDTECILDCMHVVMQNGSTTLANTLLKHENIKRTYLTYGAISSPRHSPQPSPREISSMIDDKKDKHLSVPVSVPTKRSRLSLPKTKKSKRESS